MEQNYNEIIQTRAEAVIRSMAKRVSPEETAKIREAFELARSAHAMQKRKTGEPYILHPIAVANIAAEELMMDPNSVCAAFLHDVVEDTDYTIDDIRERFGDDVAFIVGVVTKRKKDRYLNSRQLDNYRQMLESVEADIRPLLVKLADRLHNMRTLSSMAPDKQMKIAGETDYFYAPLANRLGLYNVKTELENLSFRFRCPNEYDELVRLTRQDEEAQRERLAQFVAQISETLREAGIIATVKVDYRHPYSIWRKMHKYGDDFNHLKYRHFTEVIFNEPLPGLSEKDMVLRIYSVLTNRFKEKPGGISNYIDSPKENGYQSFHLKLLAAFGRWQEVHISSKRMTVDSQLGCIAQRSEDNIRHWIEKFRQVIRELSQKDHNDPQFMDKVVSAFYNDDIMTFTPKGMPVILPQKSTVLDFAYEVGTDIGEHAKYARINGFLSSIKAPLRRGDVVEIFTDPKSRPAADWLDNVVSYRAKQAIKKYLDSIPRDDLNRCPHCMPIPGEEVIGFREADGTTTIHRRDCPIAIQKASQYGDDIVAVEFAPHHKLYHVEITIKAVDRYHLFVDLVDCISNQLELAIDNINTSTVDSIVTLTIAFGVYSAAQLQSIMAYIATIPDVDEVKRKV